MVINNREKYKNSQIKIKIRHVSYIYFKKIKKVGTYNIMGCIISKEKNENEKEKETKNCQRCNEKMLEKEFIEYFGHCKKCREQF